MIMPRQCVNDERPVNIGKIESNFQLSQVRLTTSTDPLVTMRILNTFIASSTRPIEIWRCMANPWLVAIKFAAAVGGVEKLVVVACNRIWNRQCF